MFVDIHKALDFDPTESFCIAITEKNCTVGEFLIHHFLSLAIKSSHSVIFVGLEQTLGHFHGVGLKFGINLMKSQAEGKVVFLEALKDLCNDYASGEKGSKYELSSSLSLEKVALNINEICQKTEGRITIIVDNLSVCQYIGVSAKHVLDFIRYLHSLRDRDQRISTVIRQSETESDPSDPIYVTANYAALSSDLSLQVWPLKTGHSESITGNLSYEWNTNGKTGVVQFRLEDKAVRIFALGASDAVL